jgi:hypothetical protein
LLPLFLEAHPSRMVRLLFSFTIRRNSENLGRHELGFDFARECAEFDSDQASEFFCGPFALLCKFLWRIEHELPAIVDSAGDSASLPACGTECTHVGLPARGQSPMLVEGNRTGAMRDRGFSRQ